MFKRICIIGCGLIGSSIARGIKKNKLATKVVSSNRSNSTNKKVIRLKIVDEASSDTKKIVKGSDLIIIASPLSSYKNIILKIKSSLKNGAILTDVGSVKKNAISLIEKNIPKNISWISSHPIAGTEDSGPESGFSQLFKNKWCILTPGKQSNNKDIKLLEKFWKKLGSRVDVMDAKQHDYILSITSHMPHLIAYNIVNTALKIKKKKDRNIVKYSAGGLRDFTRIAASNPIMWRDIFIQNRENTSKMIDEFIANLNDLKKAIKSKNEKKLEKIFTKTRKIRQDIVQEQPVYTFEAFNDYNSDPGNISVDNESIDLGGNIQVIEVFEDGWIEIQQDFVQNIDQDIVQDVYYEVDIVQDFIQVQDINQTYTYDEIVTETRTRLVGE